MWWVDYVIIVVKQSIIVINALMNIIVSLNKNVYNVIVDTFWRKIIVDLVLTIVWNVIIKVYV